MIHKLRWRFIRIAMLSVTVMLVILIGSVNILNYAATTAELDDMLELIAENNGIVPSHPPEPGRNSRRPAPHFTAETPFSTRYFALHYTKNGMLLHTDMKQIAAVTEDDAKTYMDLVLGLGEGTGYKGAYRYRISEVKDGEYMAIFLDCQDEMDGLQTYAWQSLGATVGCIVLVFVLILILSQKAMAPIIENMEKQKQFITDASHELKTPLTVITTNLELVEMESGKSKWIDKARIQTEKLVELVNHLVTLSRLDEEYPPMQTESFPISEAVRETAESFQEHASAQGRTLELDIADGLTLQGDQYALRQLTSILLDNAIKYSDENGRIRLSLFPARRGIELKVFNTCAGMDPSELEKLFDRFYRPDKSRNRQTGGFGIGLSIARGIAEAHGGTISAACPDVQSIEFTVQLSDIKASRKKEK